MKVMQELVAYFDRRGKLTRRQMRQLLEQGYLASDAPPTLLDLCDTAGDTYYFRVTGAVEGPLWGTDVYTGDSALGVVAVHAGVLRAGETAVVRVTVEVPLPKYVGSVRNGVTSHDFGSFGTAYRVQPISARCAPASSPGG